MAGTVTAAIRALETPALVAQAEHARPDVRRFAMLAVPLALLLVVFKVYRLEEPAFFSLACIVFGGFAVAYWLPFRFKEAFLIGLSLAGAFVLLSPVVASLLIAVGLVAFAIVRSGLTFRWKVLALLAILGVLAYGRATGRLPVPREFWPVFGALFMFRMIAYLYDVKHMPGPVRRTISSAISSSFPITISCSFPLSIFRPSERAISSGIFTPLHNRGSGGSCAAPRTFLPTA
jgi:hypothetical protein